MHNIAADDLRKWADSLFQAERQQFTIAQLTAEFPDLPIEAAYEVQMHNVRRKLAEGDRIVGHKIGLTSKAMQTLLGVHEPDYGHLFASMQYQSGDVVDYPLIQPKVEPEIAFVLKRDLEGDRIGVQDVLQATDYVLPAIEIVDSRIKDWKIGLADTVADNASSGCFVLGDLPTAIQNVNLGTIGGIMRKNGQIAESGAGAAVLGHPALAVAWLANKVGAYGTTLKKGDIVLSGAICAAIPVAPGDRVSVSFGRLGTVEISMKAEGGQGS